MAAWLSGTPCFMRVVLAGELKVPPGKCGRLGNLVLMRLNIAPNLQVVTKKLC